MHPAKSECPACVAGGRRLGHFGVVAVLLGIGLSLRKLQIEPGSSSSLHWHMLQRYSAWRELLDSRCILVRERLFVFASARASSMVRIS